MITGYVGLPGSGKTYYATKTALEYLKKGITVYSNYEIVGAYKYNSLLDVMTIREGLIIVDEINLLCPSRFWEAFPPQLAYFWSQSRKFGLDIIWTSQALSRVDTIIREITYTVFDFKKFIKPFHRYNEWLPDEMTKTKAKAVGSKMFRLKESVWKYYNTYELIDIPPEVVRAIERKMGNFGLTYVRPKQLRFVDKLSHSVDDIVRVRETFLAKKASRTFNFNFGLFKRLYGKVFHILTKKLW